MDSKQKIFFWYVHTLRTYCRILSRILLPLAAHSIFAPRKKTIRVQGNAVRAICTVLFPPGKTRLSGAHSFMRPVFCVVGSSVLFLSQDRNVTFQSWDKAGVGKLRPAGRMRPERSFYAARRHLQKLHLLF